MSYPRDGGGGDEDQLKARICELVFLISELPKDGIGATGLQASAPFIADLLVEDLSKTVPIFASGPELLEAPVRMAA